MHKQTKKLQTFYDHQATKFSGTRKRSWPEFSHIIEYIKSSFPTHKKLRILELGCGDGRLLGVLEQALNVDIQYTGVDISYNLLSIANDNHPAARWVHKDMVTYFDTLGKEEYDIVIAIASFHHLPTETQRRFVLDGIYECLSYDGVYIMTNWCYSDWFRDKYCAEIRLAALKNIITLGMKDKNDIMVPWKDSNGILISKRLYHIFSQAELTRLCKGSGFANVQHFYVTNEGAKTDNIRTGRNIVTTMQKTIWG